MYILICIKSELIIIVVLASSFQAHCFSVPVHFLFCTPTIFYLPFLTDPVVTGYHANENNQNGFDVTSRDGTPLDIVAGDGFNPAWDEESLRGSTVNLVPPGSLPGSRQGSARFGKHATTC